MDFRHLLYLALRIIINGVTHGGRRGTLFCDTTCEAASKNLFIVTEEGVNKSLNLRDVIYERSFIQTSSEAQFINATNYQNCAALSVG